MAKFITGKELETAVYNIIWEAAGQLMIVSPYIRLDNYFRDLFKRHINNPKLHILIVFGKNEGNVSKSLSQSDFDFFKQFPNVSVVYVPNLHAKYYGNELQGVITSINLHDHSFLNNIEFGVYSEVNLLNMITGSAEKSAWTTAWNIALENEAVFIKRPVYDKKIFSKSFVKSDILHDTTEKFYKSFHFGNKNSVIKKFMEFPEFVELGSVPSTRPERPEAVNESQKTTSKTELTGYCIRTGVKIPFDPSRPFSDEAFRTWVQYGNVDFPEQFCHKTGQRSNGRTSKRRPIL
jgi:hypothetical protein